MKCAQLMFMLFLGMSVLCVVPGVYGIDDSSRDDVESASSSSNNAIVTLPTSGAFPGTISQQALHQVYILRAQQRPPTLTSGVCTGKAATCVMTFGVVCFMVYLFGSL